MRWDVLGFSAREEPLDIHDDTCELYRIDAATSRTTSLEIELAEHPAAGDRFTPWRVANPLDPWSQVFLTHRIRYTGPGFGRYACSLGWPDF